MFVAFSGGNGADDGFSCGLLGGIDAALAAVVAHELLQFTC